MHETSIIRFQAFAATYLKPLKNGHVLEVGSKSYGATRGFRDSVPVGWTYSGLDIAAGDNVDIVPQHPFLWRELPDQSFDASITGQTFEHNPFFWVTMAEMARVTKANGVIFAVAPGRGPVHRFPYDCWRFYPDAWAALAEYTGLELLEASFDEPRIDRVIDGVQWCDSAAVFRRPKLDPAGEKLFQEQIAAISLTATKLVRSDGLKEIRSGKAFSLYDQEVRRSAPYVAYRRLRKLGNLRRVFHKLFVEP